MRLDGETHCGAAKDTEETDAQPTLGCRPTDGAGECQPGACTGWFASSQGDAGEIGRNAVEPLLFKTLPLAQLSLLHVPALSPAEPAILGCEGVANATGVRLSGGVSGSRTAGEGHG